KAATIAKVENAAGEARRSHPVRPLWPSDPPGPATEFTLGSFAGRPPGRKRPGAPSRVARFDARSAPVYLRRRHVSPRTAAGVPRSGQQADANDGRQARGLGTGAPAAVRL